MILKSTHKKVYKASRHIRWNWERSPNQVEELVRYHFIVVDDRNREGIMNRIIEPLQMYDALRTVREGTTFDVFDSKLKALFATYDSLIKPEFLELYRFRNPVKRDDNLKERIRGNLDDYVCNFFYPKVA